MTNHKEPIKTKGQQEIVDSLSNGPLTMADLSEATGRSKRSLSPAMGWLNAMNWIEPVPSPGHWRNESYRLK